MPHYFIDLRDGAGLHRDDDGLEFPSFEQARRAASKMLPQMAHDEIPDCGDRKISVTVYDEARRPLYEAALTFKETHL